MVLAPVAREVEGMVVVSTNGCFDGIHPGHLFYLGYCAAQGDWLVIGINSDEYIRGKKRKQPNFTEDERREMLLAIPVVNEVVIFSENDPSDFIRRTRPQIHCIGAEYPNAVEIPAIKEVAASIVFVPRIGKWAISQEDIKLLDSMFLALTGREKCRRS